MAEPAVDEDPVSLTLSVVILTYNSASTIETCLNSLVSQEFTDFDTIVVDDESTDDTVALVSRYSTRLRLSIVSNGSHNIPHGRNIGLARSRSDVVAFLDSDDSATEGWTLAIAKTFADRPELALIAGPLIPANRTRTAQAIGLNDSTVAHLVARGVMRYAAGNCALNRRVVPGLAFDEEFPAAEDLELVARVQRRHPCSYVPEMTIYHTSRDTFGQYGIQMHRYGLMKLYFGYAVGTHRWLDFVPLVLIIASIVAAVTVGPWWLVFSIVPFSLLEALFVVSYRRCRPSVAVLTFPAWMTKNLAWSAGVGHGIVNLAFQPRTRRRLRTKRSATS
jgi:glycosyltransferase involved in cell wall biosynthesis